ncbi:MAG: hypothetical protein Kow00122_08500 [Thermoleophilia bacterium]
MIVSNQEILRVLSLNQRMAGAAPAPAASPQPLADNGPAGGQDPLWRLAKIRHLRSMLATGRYTITPDVVAEKMIGRALCDQVARFYDP